MLEHHSFAPSSLAHDPRPTEREIFIKTPGLTHNTRTRQSAQGGLSNG